MEALLALVIMFGAGYGYRWYDEPECKTIKFSAPREVTDGIDIRDCKENDSTYTCPTKYPRFILSADEYRKDIENGKATRAYLNECVKVIDEYNKDKK